jgi:hypothetical protein
MMKFDLKWLINNYININKLSSSIFELYNKNKDIIYYYELFNFLQILSYFYYFNKIIEFLYSSMQT